MRVQWSDDLTTGIDKIDNQHKNLIIKVNELLQAINAGKGKRQIGSMLEFLGEYVVEHFSTEEEYMKEYNYDLLKVLSNSY